MVNKPEVQKKKERVLVAKRIKRVDMVLPDDVAELIKKLPLDERRVYATLLSNAGWTLQSIATPLGITREMVRQYGTKTYSEEQFAKVSHLPIPELPTVDVYKELYPKVLPSKEVIAQLKILKGSASKVRGRGQAYREEAELYTKLLYDTIQSGVSAYRLAKELGITVGAIEFRLVRYGYKTANGKSKVYKPLTHRKVTRNA